MPKLSVITVNYNDAAGLQRTIESVIGQSFRDFEFIIIDGGSTDGSVDVIKSYADHIDYWVSEPDGGIYAGMNKGLRQARGEYLNFMNSGDCYHSSDVLQEIFDLRQTADIITGIHAENGAENIGRNGITMFDLYRCAVDHQASFIRRELHLRHPYDERYRIVSDWKFFIEALVFDNCSFFFTDTVVVDVDMTGISNTNMQLNNEEREQVLRELFPERVLKDYQLLASVHPDIMRVGTRLTKSQSVRRVVLRLADLLLRLRGIC